MYLDLNKNLTDEQKALKQRAHEFAATVLRPAAIELDKMADPADTIAEGSPLWDVFRKAYQEGWHIRGFPEEYGGAKLGPLESHIVNEEMGWGSADFSIALSVTSFPFAFAMGRRDPDIMREVVMPFIEDREGRYIGCWAITEPGHGSDTLMPGTKYFTDEKVHYGLTARLDGDEWVLNGQKSAWVSNGTIATHALAFLGVDRKRGMAGGGVALVPLNLPGVTKGPPLNKIGQRALNQGEIFFDDVRIPKNYMFVEADAYPFAIDAVLAGANAYMGSAFTGLARAAFEEALTYSKGRIQGGVPICEHQLVQKKLFDMFVKVESARQLSRAALIYNSGAFPPGTQYSIASKVYCTQAAFEVASEAIQIHGGYGLTKEMLVEKLFRDARASMIEDGSNDILSLTAAQKLLDQYVP
ncbi:MAG TPA: acyl-CoA dehydrogenase family protein [Dehalococcoidia bacterium]|nr:acyl-CoA dehydrogenase family protein [Dehalococcoidia bacterium]